MNRLIKIIIIRRKKIKIMNKLISYKQSHAKLVRQLAVSSKRPPNITKSYINHPSYLNKIAWIPTEELTNLIHNPKNLTKMEILSR